MARKSRLKLNHQDLAINADVRTTKLSAQNLEEEPEIVRRDAKSGDVVVRQVYDKASGDVLDEGYGYRWVTEEGEEVPSEDIELYHLEDGEETKFSRHEPTLGGERTVTADTWIPVAQVDEYLVEKTYEIWGEEETDRVQLFELAEHIRDFDEAPVIPFVMQPAIYRSWGVVTPFFYDGEFAIILRVTDAKITPEHRMGIPSDDEVDAVEASESGEEAQPLEQESPFG